MFRDTQGAGLDEGLSLLPLGQCASSLMSKGSPEVGLGALVISQVPAICQTGELQGGGADLALGWEGRCLKAAEPYRALTEEGERPPLGARHQWDISHRVTRRTSSRRGGSGCEQGPGSALGLGTASCGVPLRRWFPDLPRPANQTGALLSICIAICMTTPLGSRRAASAPQRASQAPPAFLAPGAGLAWAGWGLRGGMGRPGLPAWPHYS